MGLVGESENRDCWALDLVAPVCVGECLDYVGPGMRVVGKVDSCGGAATVGGDADQGVLGCEAEEVGNHARSRGFPPARGENREGDPLLQTGNVTPGVTTVIRPPLHSRRRQIGDLAIVD